MTDKQIIKAVGICRTQDSCRGCPYHELDIAGCVFEQMKDVFDLINRQAAEIESLKHRKTELQIRNQELQHEKSEEIKSTWMMKCLKDYIDNDKIKTLAEKSEWIGNDEAHDAETMKSKKENNKNE